MRKVLDNIKKAGIHPKTAVYMIKDSVRQTLEPLDPPNPNQPGASMAVNYFTMSVHRLHTNTVTKVTGWKKVAVKLKNTDPQCWRKGFEFVYSNIRSKRKILMCFSHGAAFGINFDGEKTMRPGVARARPAQLATAPPLKLTITSNKYYYFDRATAATIISRSEGRDPFKEMIPQLQNEGLLSKEDGKKMCSRLNILWISQLADALKTNLKGKRIDLMLMNNCYMQSFDTGYLLKDSVDYLVAPEGVLDAIGYDYCAILKKVATGAVKGRALAESVIPAYEKYFTDSGEASFQAGQAVFANKLGAYPDALRLFNQFLDVLKAKMDTIIEALFEIRENKIQYVSADADTDGANTMDMIDVISWIDLVFEALPELFSGLTLKQEMDVLRGELIVAGSVGKNLTDKDAVNPKKFGYSGISIFYPAYSDLPDLQPAAWCAYFGNMIPSEWEASWKCFLAQYYHGVDILKNRQGAVLAATPK